MKKVLVLILISFCIHADLNAQNYGLQSYDTADSYAGYTLFPMEFEVHLIDNCGFAVHSWNVDNTASRSAYLLPNGNLLYPSRLNSNTTFNGGGGGGGRIDIYNQNSNLLWRYDYYQPNDYSAHHDVEPLPNGNFLVIAWEEIPAATLISMGKDPSSNTTNWWSERIVEIEPVGIGSANIVWEWYMTDHIIQDYNVNLPNYGNPVNFPNKMDLNYNSSASDWLHMNGIEYIREYDQILFSCRHINEIMVIDHSTTSAEAATDSGGNNGMGGDILWRYGNPEVYDRGDGDDKVLYGQHDAQWIPSSSSSPDAGKITVFNNAGGQNIGAGNTTTVDVIVPPVDALGNWTQPTGTNAFLPAYPESIYSSSPTGSFTASNQGGAHALPNGNILVCNPNVSELFELDANDNVVWEYEVPTAGSTFKVIRYNPSDPELAGLNLTPGPTVETPSSLVSSGCMVTYPCAIAMSISGLPSYTSSSAAISLTATPSGGSFSGPGMLFSTFNPSLAGTGLHEITYTYTDASGCTDSVTESIFVFSISYSFVNYFSSTISPKIMNLTIDSPEMTDLSVDIINLNGEILNSESLSVYAGEHSYDINVPELTPGAYIVRSYNDSVFSTYKFISH